MVVSVYAVVKGGTYYPITVKVGEPLSLLNLF